MNTEKATTGNKKPLLGHTSFETAYRVENYPYGRLRTSMFYYIETEPKKGDRFVSRTINPKNGRLNNPHKSTYSNIACMFLNEVGHVKYDGLGIYDKPDEVRAFVEWMGGEGVLLPEQMKQYNGLLHIKTVEVDEMTGAVKKGFAVKWDKDMNGKFDEVRITFDRPDGVSIGEMARAMKTLDQEKLNQVFEVRSGFLGDHTGTVRICIRGGMMLGTVSKDTYEEYLASDRNVNEDEAAQEAKARLVIR